MRNMSDSDVFSSDDTVPSSPQGTLIHFRDVKDPYTTKLSKPRPKPLPVFPQGTYRISIQDKEYLLGEDASLAYPWSRPVGKHKKSTDKPAELACSPAEYVVYGEYRTVQLLDLPVEVIEHVAFSCLDWHPTPIEFAATFVTTGYTSFSMARFTLSALSQASKHIRRVVERVLYREPQLDFTAWKGRKHSRHPAGCMKRLLRTLADRPELGNFITAAALDYPSSSSSEIEEALEMFVGMAPKLNTLAIPNWPAVFWEFWVPPHETLRSISSYYIPGFMEAALENMPGLRDLHLQDGPTAVRGMKRDVAHNLRTLRIDSCNIDVTFNLGHALKMSSTSVQELDLRFTGSLVEPVPLFVKANWKIHSSWGANITKLHLDNISILSERNINTSFVDFVGRLASLSEIHLSHHDIIAPAAFSALQRTISRITFSDYFRLWGSPDDRDEGLFMQRVAQAMELEHGDRSICQVTCWPEKSDRFYHYEPIVALCHREGIPFEVSGRSEPYIEIQFKSIKIAPSDVSTNVHRRPESSVVEYEGGVPLEHSSTETMQPKLPTLEKEVTTQDNLL